jgi:hypothetical protein
MDDLNSDAVLSPLTEGPPSPAAPLAPASDTADSSSADTAAWIRAIDQRYQRVYGNASALSLGGWALCVAAFFGLLGWRWALLLMIPISFLLMMMVMRAAVHAKGRPLYAEVEARAAALGGLDALIATARAQTPSPQFFISLVDGPLARHRRAQQPQQPRLSPPKDAS